MMNKLLIFAIFILPLVVARDFNMTNLDSSVSVGANYNIDLFTNETLNFTIPCLVSLKDFYNNTVKSFTTDPNFNTIRISRDGYVRSFIQFDDAFLVAQNYTLSIQCGDYEANRLIMIDVPGDLSINRITSNLTSMWVTHPEQMTWAAFFAFIGFSVLAFLVKEAKHL